MIPVNENILAELASRIGRLSEKDQNHILNTIRSYYVYLEVTGSKLAHFWGYRFANQLLPWMEPGYVSDGAQTNMYTLELHQDLGFRVN